MNLIGNLKLDAKVVLSLNINYYGRVTIDKKFLSPTLRCFWSETWPSRCCSQSQSVDSQWRVMQFRAQLRFMDSAIRKIDPLACAGWAAPAVSCITIRANSRTFPQRALTFTSLTSPSVSLVDTTGTGATFHQGTFRPVTTDARGATVTVGNVAKFTIDCTHRGTSTIVRSGHRKSTSVGGESTH